MILPIAAYGSPVLRNIGKEISPDYPDLQKLIADMWDTMYNSNGVGLAAPQVSKSIRLFVVDSCQIFENREEGDIDYPDAPGFKGVFINPKILEEFGEACVHEEGCLSIPRVRSDVERMEKVKIAFMDEYFQPKEMDFYGITARVILHEYDHIEGKLFIDRIKPLKRTLLKRKLDDISKGKINVDYKMTFPK